jgi:hypothetical protein
MPAPVLALADLTLPPRGALIGLDLGTKTIGVATSDPDRRLATASRPWHARRRRCVTACKPSPRHCASKLAHCPGCAGAVVIWPPTGMHWLGGSGEACSTLATSRSKAFCAWG